MSRPYVAIYMDHPCFNLKGSLQDIFWRRKVCICHIIVYFDTWRKKSIHQLKGARKSSKLLSNLPPTLYYVLNYMLHKVKSFK